MSRGKCFWGIVLLSLFGIIGCFLPWKYTPGFIAYPIIGIQLLPNIEDNGGVIVIMAFILEIIFYRLFQKELLRNVINLLPPMIIPIIIGLGNILKVTIWIIEKGNIEPPTIGIGTNVILLCSILITIIIFITERQLIITRK